MYFILALLFILSVILSIIFYGVMQEVLIPKFLASRHAARLSRIIYRLMIEIRNDWFAHLQTLCEHDGDEPFEPFLDSPLHTCPPTEFYLSPPKEETETRMDGNNNYGNGVPPRRRRPRVVLPIPERHAPQIPQLLLAQQQNQNPIPAVVMRRLHAIRPRPLVREIERLGQNEEVNEANQIAVGVRRVMQLRQFQVGVLSPPPQEIEGERFQFD